MTFICVDLLKKLQTMLQNKNSFVELNIVITISKFKKNITLRVRNETK